jgi:hypothetical protein
MVKASDIFGTSSGGGTPVNGIRPLYLPGLGAPDLYQDTSGHTWLKTGSVETDYSRYPDADFTSSLAFTGEEYSLGITNPRSGCFDGTHYWVAQRAGGTMGIHQYTSDWTKTGTIIDTSAHLLVTNAVAFDGTYLVVTGENNNNRAVKFDLAGNHISSHDLDTYFDELYGLYWNGTHYIASGKNTVNQTRISYFDTAFNHLASHYPTGVSNPMGVIELKDGRFLLVQGSGNVVLAFDHQWQLITTYTSPLTSPSGLVSGNGTLYVISDGSNKLLPCIDQWVGDIEAHTDTDTGYPLYVRIG